MLYLKLTWQCISKQHFWYFVCLGMRMLHNAKHFLPTPFIISNLLLLCKRFYLVWKVATNNYTKIIWMGWAGLGLAAVYGPRSLAGLPFWVFEIKRFKNNGLRIWYTYATMTANPVASLISPQWRGGRMFLLQTQMCCV